MAKALKIIGTIAVVAGLAIVTGGAALGLGVALSTTAFGISAGALIAAGTVLSTAGSLLSPKPRAPTASPSNADRLQVSIDVRTPRKIVFGSTAMATDLRDQEWSGNQEFLHRFIVVASHRVQAIREIWFDDALAWSSTEGVQGKYAGYLAVTPVLEGSAANAINIGPRMGSSRRYTGCAYVYLRYKLTGNSKKTESPFAGSIPSRMTIVGDGMPLYDPRLDSTVPGGSGPQRANDQATWAWTPSAGRNNALQALTYQLGWRINGKLAVGKGLPAARLDMPSFITGANICDEGVATPGGGTEPRYRSDGIFSEGDATELVNDGLKASMNAVLDDVDGKIRLTVLHNDLAAPIGDLTTADVLGEFTWAQTPPLNDTINVIRGGYTNPSSQSLYQLTDYPEVRVESPDGIDRPQRVDLPLVQSGTQAQRLVKLRLSRAQYGGTFTAVFQATAWKFQKGDVIRFSFYPLGWENKLFRIADMAIQVDGTVPMMLREEHPAIYAAYDDAAAVVQATAPTSYDPALWPVLSGIIDAGRTAEWPEVTGPGRPEDNATVGAPVGTPVGDRPAEQVVADLDKAIDDIVALVDTYGDTETANAARVAAEAARDAAVVARANAQVASDQSQAARDAASAARDAAIERAQAAAGSAGTASEQATIATSRADAAGQSASIAEGKATIATTKAGEASTSASNAATSESNALGSKNAAASSAGVAATHAATAGDKATAAAGSAFSAATSADQAGQRASAAESARTAAETARGQAETFRNQASSSEQNAAGSASTASQQASLSASARNEAAAFSKTTGLTANGRFAAGPDQNGWLVSGNMVYGNWFVGKGYRVSSDYGNAAEATFTPVDTSRVYQINANVTVHGPAGATTVLYVGVSCYDANQTFLGNSYMPAFAGLTPAGNVYARSNLLRGEEGSPVAYRHSEHFVVGTRYIKLIALLNYPEPSPTAVTIDLASLFIEDITSEQSSKDAANASSTSASTATAKATEAGTSATAANQSRLDAQAANGAAQGAAQVADQRAAFADGRASAASHSAQLAADYYNGIEGSPLAARVSATETAVSDGRFATAQRASNIETTVGNVSARVSGTETAISDGRFAAASTLNQLRSEYNGTAATVTQQAGTIAGLGQKTAAYVRVVADAGNGRAALSLWSDQFGGAWQLTGDGLISGNLTVDGTFTARKFDRTSMSRDGSAVWTGSITPSMGQTVNVPWGLSLTQVPPLGRFIYEYSVALSTNAGQQQTSTFNGKPAYTNFIADGGLNVRAVDQQGNVYVPRANGSSIVLATTDFVPSWSATLSRGNTDTGFVLDGDYYTRNVSATYTLSRLDLRVTWVAI